MTSYKAVPPQTARPKVPRWLLVLIFAGCQLIARCSVALPEVVFRGHFTDRIAPHAIAGWPQGDFVQISAALETSDPAGGPSIVVNAKQGDTTLTLDWYSLPSTIYPSPHLYYKFIALDPALTGPWQITATDSTGVGASVFTNPIAAPEFLPAVEDIRVGGRRLRASVEWALPDLTGFDVEWTQVRVVQVSPLAEVFQSEFFPATKTSFELPPGSLQSDVDYVYSINLTDFEGANRENRSGALSEIFRYTMPGDFNSDGVVDAADLAQWQGDFGANADSDADDDGDSDGDDLLAWQRQLGSGLPAVGSSAAVPEPATFTLLILAATLQLRGWSFASQESTTRCRERHVILGKWCPHR